MSLLIVLFEWKVLLFFCKHAFHRCWNNFFLHQNLYFVFLQVLFSLFLCVYLSLSLSLSLSLLFHSSICSTRSNSVKGLRCVIMLVVLSMTIMWGAGHFHWNEVSLQHCSQLLQFVLSLAIYSITFNKYNIHVSIMFITICIFINFIN